MQEFLNGRDLLEGLEHADKIMHGINGSWGGCGKGIVVFIGENSSLGLVFSLEGTYLTLMCGLEFFGVVVEALLEEEFFLVPGVVVVLELYLCSLVE